MLQPESSEYVPMSIYLEQVQTTKQATTQVSRSMGIGASTGSRPKKIRIYVWLGYVHTKSLLFFFVILIKGH